MATASVIDGKTIISIVFLLGFVILSNLIHDRWNPKPERYMNDPNGIPAVAFWNIFSTKKWTPEGVRYNERRMFFAFFVALPVFLVGWLTLGWIL